MKIQNFHFSPNVLSNKKFPMSKEKELLKDPKNKSIFLGGGGKVIQGIKGVVNNAEKSIDNALERTYETVSSNTVNTVENVVKKTTNVVKNTVEGTAKFTENVVKNTYEGAVGVVKTTGDFTKNLVTDIMQHDKKNYDRKIKQKKGEIEIVTSFDVVRISGKINTENVYDLKDILYPFSDTTKEETFPEEYTKVLFDKKRKVKKDEDEISLSTLKGTKEDKKTQQKEEDDDEDDFEDENAPKKGTQGFGLKKIVEAVGFAKRRENTNNRQKKDLKVIIDMRAHNDVLRNYKKMVSEVLIRDVTFNYKLFLSFSKEISKVESELIEVGKQWNEIKRTISVVTEMNKDPLKLKLQDSDTTFEQTTDSNERNKILEDFYDILVDFHRCLSIRDWSLCLERYEKGVSIIEMTEQVDMKKYRPEFVQDFMKSKEEFSFLLLSELRNPVASFSTIQSVISILKKLNLKDQAVSVYLEAKGIAIKKEISKIYSTGNNIVYANIYSGLFFMNLKKCSDQFKQLFAEEQTSEFLKWVVKELQTFCEQFREKVLSMCSNDFKTVSLASNIVFTHAEKLSETGISITFKLRDFFRKDIETAMTKYFDDAQKKLSQNIQLETWNGSNIELPTRQSDTLSAFTTETGKELYLVLLNFIEILSSIASTTIYQIAVTSITHLIIIYFEELDRAAKTVSMNDKQFFSLISNASFVNRGLLPMIQRELKPIFRELPELNRITKQTGTIDKDLLKIFCQTRAEVITTKLGFHQMGYPVPIINDEFNVSRGFAGLSFFLSNLLKDLDKYEKLRFKEIILPTIIEKIIDNLSEKGPGTFMERLGQSKVSLDRLKSNDIYSVIIDLKFFSYCCSEFLEKPIKTKLENLIKSIIEKYEFNFESLDKDEKFYDKIIQECIKKNSQVSESLKYLRGKVQNLK